MKLKDLEEILIIFDSLKKDFELLEKEKFIQILNSFLLSKLLMNQFITNMPLNKSFNKIINQNIKDKIAELLRLFGLVIGAPNISLDSYVNSFYKKSIFNLESITLSIIYNSIKIPQKDYGFYDLINYIANNLEIEQELKIKNIRTRISIDYYFYIEPILFLLKFLGIIHIRMNKNQFIYNLRRKIQFYYDIDAYEDFLLNFNENTNPFFIFVAENFTDPLNALNYLKISFNHQSSQIDDLRILKTLQERRDVRNYYEIEIDIKLPKTTKTRDSILAHKLKSIYNYSCQICEKLEVKIPKFKTNLGIYYCEVHHIIPLSKQKGAKKWENFMEKKLIEKMEKINDLDIIENMIVLCPYHHRFIHYYNQDLKFLKSIGIEDNYHFISKNKKEKYSVYSKNGHYNNSG